MSNNYSMNLNLERLNKLNEKLNNVRKNKFNEINFFNLIYQTTTEGVKNSKYEFLANRTVDLNDRLDEVINQSTNKFNIIKDNVRKKNLIFINLDKFNW